MLPCSVRLSPDPGTRLHTAIYRVAAATFLSLLLSGGTLHAAPAPDPYSLSVEVVYGSQPSRRSYVEEMQRRLRTWVGARGALHAPVKRGTADLHLRVIVDELDRGRGYPEKSGGRDVFLDMPGSASSPFVYHTRFELSVSVVDPMHDGRVVVQDRFTIYNETRETRLITNPELRSWEDNLQFMVDRIRRFLSRRDGKIRRYLRDNPRLPAVAPGSDKPR